METASVACHLAAMQSHVLQKLDAKELVAERYVKNSLFASPLSLSEARP
jgi:hypothetical protein